MAGETIQVISPEGVTGSIPAENWPKAEARGFKIANPTSKMESAGRAAKQGLTLGFGDELTGAYAAAAQSPADWLYEKLNAQDPSRSPSAQQLYKTARDEDRVGNAVAKASNPGIYGVTEFGASMVPLMLAGPGVGPAIATSAAMGVGNSEADTLGGLAKDAAIGAGSGLAGYGAGKALQAGISRLPTAASVAQRAAVRSTNADRTATERALKGSSSLREKLGQFMLDEQFPLRSPAGIKDRALAIQGQLGPEFANLTRAASSSGATADLATAIAKAKASPQITVLQKNTETLPVYDRVVAMLDDQLARHGNNVTPEVAHDLRMQLDKLAKWDVRQPQAISDAWRAARREVDDALGAAMDAAGRGGEWASVNDRFRLAKLLSTERPGVMGRGLADVGESRLAANRFAAPSEKAAAVVGGGMALASGDLRPLLLPLIARGANRYTFPSLARTSQAASKVPGFADPAQALAPFGKLAPAAGAVAGVGMAPHGRPSSPVPSPHQLAAADPVVGDAYRQGGPQAAAATFYSEAQRRPEALLSWMNESP